MTTRGKPNPDVNFPQIDDSAVLVWARNVKFSLKNSKK